VLFRSLLDKGVRCVEAAAEGVPSVCEALAAKGFRR